MNNSYKTLEVFDYSTSAQITKSKLESEDVRVILTDAITIDADPLLSQAIGGVKLQVHIDDFIKAKILYDSIRPYERDDHGNELHCIKCKSNRILIAPPREGKLWYMLFPFFEKKKYICNDCKTIFK